MSYSSSFNHSRPAPLGGGKTRPGNPGGWGYSYKGKQKQNPTQHQHPSPKPGGHKKSGGGGAGKMFPTGPLTMKQFNLNEHAAEAQQFDPLQRQLEREAAASDFRRQQEDPAWFAQYKQDVANLGNQTQQAYANAQQSITNLSAQSGQQDAANRAASTQQLQQDAAMRGTTVDPSIIANGVNAANARQQMLGQQNATVATLGANQAAYSNNRQSIADQFQREAQTKELARLFQNMADQRELASKRGDFATTFRSDALDAERKYQLGQQTIAGENNRASLSAKTSRQNSKRSSATSRANNANSTATSRANNANTVGNSAANSAASRRAQNIRDRKNRNERRWAHNHPQASNSGKTKPNKKK